MDELHSQLAASIRGTLRGYATHARVSLTDNCSETVGEVRRPAKKKGGLKIMSRA